MLAASSPPTRMVGSKTPRISIPGPKISAMELRYSSWVSRRRPTTREETAATPLSGAATAWLMPAVSIISDKIGNSTPRIPVPERLFYCWRNDRPTSGVRRRYFTGQALAAAHKSGKCRGTVPSFTPRASLRIKKLAFLGRRRHANALVARITGELLNILLIEDDKETSAHIVYALGKEGHEVELCHDGREGLERARGGGHGALIVDRMLPGMDGLSLVRHLREEGSQTPVLFLTTMSGLDDRVEGLQAGARRLSGQAFCLSRTAGAGSAITRRSQRSEEPVRLARRRSGNGPDPPHGAARRARPSSCRRRNSGCWNF